MRFPTLCAALALAACGAPTPREPVSAPSSGAATTVRIGLIDWYTDYDAAVVVARRRDAPLLLHFGENPG